MLKLLVFSALVALVSGCVNPPCRCKPFPCDDYDNLKISHRSSDRCAPQDYVCQARVRMENGGNIKNYRSTDSYCAPQDYICQAKRRDRLLALMDPRQNPDGPGRTQQPVPHPSGRPSGPVRTVPGPSEPEPQPDPDGRETLPGPSKPQPLPGPNEREPQPVPDVPKDPKEMKVYFDKKLQEAATVLEYFPEKKPEFRLKFLTDGLSLIKDAVFRRLTLPVLNALAADPTLGVKFLKMHQKKYLDDPAISHFFSRLYFNLVYAS